MIPSEVKIKGYSLPEEFAFDNSVREDGEDVGPGPPEFSHFYEVSNMGVSTVRIQINGVWPMWVRESV